MYKTLTTFNLPVVPMKLNWSGVFAYVGLVILLFVIMNGVKDVPVGEALVGSLVGLVLHVVINHVHQMGHAIAARQTGYPMVAWRTNFIVSTSLYPDDEPELPAEVHIRRALGGQYFSLPLFIIGVIAAVLILPDHGVAGVLAVFFLIDSFVYSLGALIPTPFLARIIEIDGTTIWKWWPKRGQSVDTGA